MKTAHCMLPGQTIQAYKPLHRHTYSFQSSAILERKRCNTFLFQEIVLIIGSVRKKGTTLGSFTTQLPPSRINSAVILVNGNLILCVAQTKYQRVVLVSFFLCPLSHESTNKPSRPTIKICQHLSPLVLLFLLQLQLNLLSSSPKT